MFVDGAWTGAVSGETFTADSPATGEVIADIPQGSREDAQRAIDAANRAADQWSRTTAFERAAFMHRVADAVEARRDELAHTLTLDQGKPLHESRDEVEELIAYWRNAAEDGKRLEGRLANSFTPGKRVLLVRRPRGVIGVITPWNWPYTMPAELIAPALASGNTVVWTPASTPACFVCAGQTCTAGERLLVHRAVREEFVAKLRERVQSVVLGDPFDESTTMGPLNNVGVADKMDEHVGDAVERGATVVHGGSRAQGFPTNLYWQPTVLDGVSPDALVAQEETFGRVAPVVEIESLEQAIELTNASPYGLLSAIFTRDLAQGLRFADSVRTGWVNINDSSNYWEAHLPFGGRSGTASGIGRVGGSAPMESFTELQTVVVS